MLAQLAAALVLLLLITITFIHKERIKRFLIDLRQKSVIIRMRNIADESWFVFLISGILGIFMFMRVYGVVVLDFTNTEWLMRGGDATTHYIGWRFFRNSDWFFPIGLMDNILYPLKESVIFSDSIPLFAVIFKLISPVLPENFQYFGFYGVICFFLQGAFSGLIIKKLCKSSIYAIVGSVFFSMSSMMILRLFPHTALASHYIIMLCIYACISKDDKHRSILRNIAIWGSLYAIASSTHLYFVPVVTIFLFFYLLVV